ncbi:MAG: hypothetical protein ACR2FY_03680 [Pirellulaceae bacterium]
MPLIATCPSCQQSYQVGEQFAGQTAKCRACGHSFVVPFSDDPFAAAAAMQSSLAPLPGDSYSFASASNPSSPHGGGYGAAAYSQATQDSSYGSGDSFSAGEPVEWALRPGITCSILGVGGFLLPLLGVQFKILALLGAAAPIVAGLLALAGAVLVFLGLKDNLLKAVPAAGGVIVLAFGAFALSAFAENANNQQNNALGQPLPAGPRPSGPIPIRPNPNGPPGAPFPQPGNGRPGTIQPGSPVQPPRQNSPPGDNQRQFAEGELLNVIGELPPLDLQPPATSLPKLPPYEVSQILIAGKLREEPGFRDMAPAGSWLVGLRVVQSKNWGGAVCGVQPIYQSEGQYIPGEYCGAPGGLKQVLLLAKPGFAVSAVQVQSGLAMNALQLQYLQVKGEAMATEGAYPSEWVGCEGGGLQPLLDGKGQPIVGLDGTFNQDLTALRLFLPTR